MKKNKTAAKKKPASKTESLSGMNPILSLFGGDDSIKEITIKNIHGKTKTVSLELPAAREVKAMKPLSNIREKIEALKIEIPPAIKGEDEDAYYKRIAGSMIGAAGNVFLAFVTEELIEAAAAILGEEVEAVGENYKSEELVALIVPFFGNLLGGMLKKAAALGKPNMENISSEQVSDS